MNFVTRSIVQRLRAAIFLFILTGVGLKVLADTSAHDTIIGIDLGTTYSCVAVYQQGRAEIIANEQGNRITPSYIAWTEQGERLIGDGAKNQATANPENSVFDVKRLIGRTFDDPDLQADIQNFPFEVVGQQNQPRVRLEVNDEPTLFSPEELSAMVLGKMKQIAEDYLGHSVQRAVITVPAYFNDAQRQATKDAGAIAGLTVERIINEPTAAALAYGTSHKAQQERQVLVFDLGGGTFDVSLLTLDEGVFEVMATAGDTHLGGEDFDRRLMEHFRKIAKKKYGLDLTGNQRALQKLRREVEKAKRSLSSAHQASVEIDSLADGVDFRETLTRSKFEQINIDLFKKTLASVTRVLEDAEVKREAVDEIILVGGSSRIPKVQALLKDYFGGRELTRGINPDEAVAYGASVQAAVLSGDPSKEDVILLDVNPLSLGIETMGGVFTVLVARNTVIPTKKAKIFSTAADNQPTVTIQVYEGERPMTRDNHRLGQFDLTGIAPAPRGVPQIDVTFAINENGLLTVSAQDKGTGREENIVIKQDTGRLSQEDIDRMVQEAEQYAETDQQVKAKVEAQQQLESYLYGLRHALDSNEDDGWVKQLSESDRETLQSTVQEAMAWLDEHQDASQEDYEAQRQAVETVVSPITESLYANNQDRDEL